MRIFNDISRLTLAASRVFVREAGQALAARGRFMAVLSGGTTPIGLYQLLSQADLDWSKMHLFWGDERCVPVDNVENNYGQARKAWLQHVSIPEENIHRIKSELSPDKAAADYARVLEKFADPPLAWPRFDLVLLGMGADGHIASLFPGSPVDPAAPVIPVTADYHDRPTNRVTLTPRVFNSARHIIFLVSGVSKSQTLADVLKGDRQPAQLPAQRIQPADGKVTWMADAQAAGKL
jgi:6-phosphogluconolactonase